MGNHTFQGFSFLQLVFLWHKIRESHNITWNICKCWLWNVYTWDKQTTWYGWALPCRKSYHCHSFQGYSDLLFRSFSVFNIQHFNGWMQGAILLKNMHRYFVGICFADLFLCRTHEQLIKMVLENLTNTSVWSHKTFNPQGIKININNSLPQQTFCLPRSPFNLGTFHTPQKCLY